MVHISTDYVFDGEKRSAYVEDGFTPAQHLRAPASWPENGGSPLRGDGQIILVRARRHLRAQRLPGARGTSYVETVIKARPGGHTRACRHRAEALTPTASVDRSCAPACRHDRAQCAGRRLSRRNAGSCSWFEFAREIFRHRGCHDWHPRRSPRRNGRFAPVQPALRTRSSRIARSLPLGIDGMPEWPDALSAATCRFASYGLKKGSIMRARTVHHDSAAARSCRTANDPGRVRRQCRQRRRNVARSARVRVSEPGLRHHAHRRRSRYRAVVE